MRIIAHWETSNELHQLASTSTNTAHFIYSKILGLERTLKTDVDVKRVEGLYGNMTDLTHLFLSYQNPAYVRNRYGQVVIKYVDSIFAAYKDADLIEIGNQVLTIGFNGGTTVNPDKDTVDINIDTNMTEVIKCNGWSLAFDVNNLLSGISNFNIVDEAGVWHQYKTSKE